MWKDSNQPDEYKPIRYRKHIIQGTPKGWVTDIPGDDKLYKNNYSAQNAVDAFYGDFGKRGTEKRKKYGIQIIGKRNGESA